MYYILAFKESFLGSRVKSLYRLSQNVFSNVAHSKESNNENDDDIMKVGKYTYYKSVR